jgi:hypothetical protein
MGLLSKGGWGGLGQQMVSVADQNISMDFARERDAVREQAAKRLAEHGDKLRRDSAEWEVKTLGPEKNKNIAEGVKATEQARHDVKFDPANVEAELSAFKKQAKAKSDAEIDEMIATSKNPGYIKAIRNIALARHIVDPRIVLQPQADGTVLRIDANAGKVLGTLNDPVSGNPIKSPKGMSEQQMALVKSYFDEGANLMKNGEMEEGQSKLSMGRDILMGKQPKEPTKPGDRPPLNSFFK